MMRAISLYQPYASLMAHGIKKNETRGRYTHVRGELAICSALKGVILTTELRDICSSLNLLSPPRGYVVGVVSLDEVVPTEVIRREDIGDEEWYCGDYSANRWAWKTVRPRLLTEPVPVKGHQGFFFLPPDVEAKVRNQAWKTKEDGIWFRVMADAKL